MKKKELLKLLDDVEILYRDTLGFSEDITFGLEIEYIDLHYIEALKLIEKKYNKWGYQKDETVFNSGFGGEVVSPILCDTKEAWVELRDILVDLKDNFANIDDSTAAHIHVGSTIFNEDINKYLYFLKMWTVFEKEIYQFSYGEFDHMRDKYKLFSSFIRPNMVRNYYGIKKVFEESNGVFIDDLHDIISFLGKFRNLGVNLRNVKEVDNLDKNTIEFRTFNGTLDKRIWQNNVNFVLNFLEYFNGDYDKELIDYYFKKCSELPPNLGCYKLDKGILLGNLIFKDDIDYLYYLKQYTKGMKK